MTISRNRIRYLDKENKVLVQDFSDISVNIPMTDVETPMTIEAMDAIDEAFRYLQSIQNEILDIVDFLTSENIGQLLIDTLLNNLRLNLPGFPQVAMFIQSLRNLNPAILGGIVNALMMEMSAKVLDNPSLINRKDKNVQQQLMNLALTEFGRKLQSGEITPAYIQQLANSTAVEDPYAIQSAIQRLNSDFKYNTNEQAKFTLPNEERVANLVIAHLSISLAYYNYYYTTVRPEESLLNLSDFIASAMTGDLSVNEGKLSLIKTELSQPTHDASPLSYFLGKTVSDLLSGLFTELQLQVDNIAYFSSYQAFRNYQLTYLKQQTTGKVPDPYRETLVSQFADSLLSRLSEFKVEVDSTPEYVNALNGSLSDEWVYQLQSVLLSYLKAGTASTDALKVYLLTNAKATLVQTLLERKNTVDVGLLPTFYRILSTLESLDIYKVEGRNDLVPYQIQLTKPVISFEKISVTLFFDTLLEQLRLIDRQNYIQYPKDQAIGLIEKLVFQINQSKLDLISNHPYLPALYRDPDKTGSDLKTTMSPEDLRSHFFPVRFNNHDKDIYKHYQRDLRSLTYTDEDVYL